MKPHTVPDRVGNVSEIPLLIIRRSKRAIDIRRSEELSGVLAPSWRGVAYNIAKDFLRLLTIL